MHRLLANHDCSLDRARSYDLQRTQSAHGANQGASAEQNKDSHALASTELSQESRGGESQSEYGHACWIGERKCAKSEHRREDSEEDAHVVVTRTSTLACSRQE